MKRVSSTAASMDSVPTWVIYAATVLTGGLTWFATKFQIGTVSPEVSLAYRFFIAAVVLLAVAIKMRVSLKFGAIDHLRIAMLGFLVFFGSFSLIYLALAHLTSGLVALVFSMVLLLNVINSMIFLGRALEIRVVLGAMLGLSGLVLIFWPEVADFNITDTRTTAVLQMLVAAGLFSFGNMISARLQKDGVEVLPSTGLAMGYGAVFLSLLAFFAGKPFLFEHSWPYVVSLLYLALFGSVVGYVTYFIVVGRVGPERAAYALILTPALALLVSTLFEDFTWTGRGLLGISLVLLGNVVVLRKRASVPEPFRVTQ